MSDPDVCWQKVPPDVIWLPRNTAFSHKCQELCYYCCEEGGLHDVPCKLLAGHIGRCHCEGKSHECGKPCSLSKYFNCSQHCVQKANHEGECFCITERARHLCGAKCSLDGCNERCIRVYDEKHKKHMCHRNKCPMVCELCTEECASENHFHALDSPNENHLCRREHQCPDLCKHGGICEINTYRKFKKREMTTHDGKKVNFEEYSLQNGARRRCCIRIPPGKVTHEGKHTCIPPEIEAEEKGAECHTCSKKCKQCGYFCTLPYKHNGLCACTHGNMRNTNLLTEENKECEELHVKVIDQDKSSGDGDQQFQIHKISRGSSGIFTTCTLACMAKDGNGRGHIHLVPCKYSSEEACKKANHLIKDQRRHQSCVYDKDVMYDEVKCEYFWKKVLRFKSSFSPQEKEQFNLCASRCGIMNDKVHENDCGHDSGNRMAKESEASKDGKNPFCMLDLWHPKQKPGNFGDDDSNKGYVSCDGHLFPCKHGNLASHTYFIIDNSTSMNNDDVQPSIYRWIIGNPLLKNRLGLVLEAMSNYVKLREKKCKNDLFSMITFNSHAKLVCSGERMKRSVVKRKCRGLQTRGNTQFIKGFKVAFDVLGKRRSVDSGLTPVFIIFTDGEDLGDKEKCKRYLREQCAKIEGKIVIHAIGFSSEEETERGQYLRDIAEIGGGVCYNPSDEIEVTGAFSVIAKNPTKSSFV